MRTTTTSGTYEIEVSGPGGSENVEVSGASDGQWHSYCLTYDYDGSNGVMYLWIDGAQAGTLDPGGGLGTYADYVMGVGAYDATTGFLDGTVDELQIYSGCLSSDSVATIAGTYGAIAEDSSDYGYYGDYGNYYGYPDYGDDPYSGFSSDDDFPGQCRGRLVKKLL